MHLIKRFSNETAREYAYRMLRDNIVSLELVPGSTASVYELSEKLGISRTPVREALLELNKTGIIEVYPQKGNVISYIDFEAANEARFLRLAIERAILEEVCDLITEKDFEELEFNIQLQKVALQNHHTDKLLELDNEFHLKLFQIANKERLFYIKDSLYIHFDRIRSIRLAAINDDRIVCEHRKIIKALKDKNKEDLRDAIDSHLSGYSKEEQETIRKAYPKYFLDK